MIRRGLIALIFAAFSTFAAADNLTLMGASGGDAGVAPTVIAITPVGDSLTAQIDFDPNTTTQPTIGTFRNQSTQSNFNWALSRNAQPWYYTGNWGQSGETTVQILARITPALTAAAAVPGGQRGYGSTWGGTNDIPNLGGDSAATIAARIENIATDFQSNNARPIFWKLVGSELWSSANVQRLIDVNSALQTYYLAHLGDTLKPIWVDLPSIMWWSPPDATQTANSVCTSQTPSSGVPLTLATNTIAGGRKLLFTYSEGSTRSVAIVGTLNSVGVSETLSLPSTAALVSSQQIYDTITSITPAATFTNPITVGWTGITQQAGWTVDGLHPNATGAWNGSAALYNAIIADATLIPFTRPGSNALLNPLFATATGGSVTGSNMTVNGVAASSSNVPQNWRVDNSSANITAANWIFGTDGSVTLTATANSSASLNSIFLRQDPSTALFTAGSTWEIWTDFDVTSGATGLAALNTSLSVNYTPQAFTALTAVWDSSNGGQVTITTTSPHGLTTGESMPCVISGMTPSGYNQAAAPKCLITGASTFTYELVTNPGTATVLGSGTLGGVMLYYSDRNSSTASGLVPSTSNQHLTYRCCINPFTQTYGIPILHGLTISTVNYISGIYFNGAGTATVKFSSSPNNMWLAKTNWLLNRDLNPSANDNTPVWLDAVG